MEILDPGYRVIAKSDLEEEDAHELTKSKTLYDLAPGKYLIHLYLQSRLDTADFIKKGGRSGPAVVPGKSGQSVLIEANGALRTRAVGIEGAAAYLVEQFI